MTKFIFINVITNLFKNRQREINSTTLGVTPAKGVSIVVRAKNSIASITASGNTTKDEPLYTTLTDSDGIFSFDTIPIGLYVIEGSDDKGNMVLYDSVLINNLEKTIILPDDTLEPAGVITGTIALGEGGNYLQFFVLAFGVDRFCQVQTDGIFLMRSLPYGNYTLKIVCVQKEYGNSLTVYVTLKSGDTTDIGDLVMAATEVCMPENVVLNSFSS